jgi:hypothetical protein
MSRRTKYIPEDNKSQMRLPQSVDNEQASPTTPGRKRLRDLFLAQGCNGAVSAIVATIVGALITYYVACNRTPDPVTKQTVVPLDGELHELDDPPRIAVQAEKNPSLIANREGPKASATGTGSPNFERISVYRRTYTGYELILAFQFEKLYKGSREASDASINCKYKISWDTTHDLMKPPPRFRLAVQIMPLDPAKGECQY